MQDAYSSHTSDHGAKFSASDAAHTSGPSDSTRVSIPGAYFNHHTGYSHGAEFAASDAAHTSGPSDSTRVSIQRAYFNHHTGYSHGVEFISSDAAHTSGPTDFKKSVASASMQDTYSIHSSDHGAEFAASNAA